MWLTCRSTPAASQLWSTWYHPAADRAGLLTYVFSRLTSSCSTEWRNLGWTGWAAACRQTNTGYLEREAWCLVLQQFKRTQTQKSSKCSIPAVLLDSGVSVRRSSLDLESPCTTRHLPSALCVLSFHLGWLALHQSSLEDNESTASQSWTADAFASDLE